MPQPYATADDVEARWRPLSDQERSRADVLGQDASSLIRARFPDIDSQVTTGAVDPNVLTLVAAGMVRRAMTAPSDGVSQQSETVGPFGRSQSFANPLGNVFITQADLTLILGYQPSGMSGRFTNATSRVENAYVAFAYNGFVDPDELPAP